MANALGGLLQLITFLERSIAQLVVAELEKIININRHQDSLRFKECMLRLDLTKYWLQLNY